VPVLIEYDGSGIVPYPGMGSAVPQSLEALLMGAPGAVPFPPSFAHLAASAPSGFGTGSASSSDDDMPSLEPVASRSQRARSPSPMLPSLFPTDATLTSGSALIAEAVSSNPYSLRRSTRSAAAVARTALGNRQKRSRTNTLASAEPTSLAPTATKPPPAKKARTGESSPSTNLKQPPAQAKNDADYGEETEATGASCCICMSQPDYEEKSTIDGCDHQFCFGCISKWADRENTCPLCKHRFSKITRVHPVKRKKGAPPNSKKVKQRDQRADIISGTALEGLLASLTGNRHIAGARMRSFLLARMSGAGGLFGPAVPPRHLHERFTFSLEDAFFADSDDDDNEEAYNITLSHFTHTRRSAPGATSADARAPPRMMVPSFFAAANVSDRLAGRNSSNPIEIADDSDDDDVQVVQVSHSST